MSVSLKPVGEQVIVITGASSGIGLATAHAAAEQGAKVVLASRNKSALADIQRKIAKSGGQAMHVETDVGKKSDLDNLAKKTIERFGTFDTWINNAGVSIYGRLEQVKEEDSRKLFDTNFWGIVNGSLVAVEHLKRRGGALINLGSVASDVALPIQGMYAASKHAIKGFTDALRMELEETDAPVSVTLIKPGAIDTPFPKHAKNYTGKEVTLPPPVYQPKEVADAILYAAANPVRDLYVGGSARAMSALQSVAPGMMDWIFAKTGSGQQLTGKPARNGAGSLHQAGQDGSIRGSHQGYVAGSSLYTQAAIHPLMSGLVLGVGAAAVVALLGSSRGNGSTKMTRSQLQRWVRDSGLDGWGRKAGRSGDRWLRSARRQLGI